MEQKRFAQSQRATFPRNRRLLKTLAVNSALFLSVTLATGLYVMTAPPPSPQVPAKLQFHGRAALRKRPSLESAPIAYSKRGTKLEVLHAEGDWVRVRIEGSIKGWTQRDQGTIIPPPPLQLTRRQRVNQWIQDRLAALRDFSRVLYNNRKDKA
ncbi:MAG: SH3 domain-containing protein [Candidatus Poribacteria bacterium]|nr:SH3 domain-containing protein [Candidatus Poribacteria bacterium]